MAGTPCAQVLALHIYARGGLALYHLYAFALIFMRAGGEEIISAFVQIILALIHEGISLWRESGWCPLVVLGRSPFKL